MADRQRTERVEPVRVGHFRANNRPVSEAGLRQIILDRATARPAAFRGPFSEIVRWLSTAYLKLSGWGIEGDWPALKKAVLVAAPHQNARVLAHLDAVADHHGHARAGEDVAAMVRAAVAVAPLGASVTSTEVNNVKSVARSGPPRRRVFGG